MGYDPDVHVGIEASAAFPMSCRIEEVGRLEMSPPVKHFNVALSPGEETHSELGGLSSFSMCDGGSITT